MIRILLLLLALAVPAFTQIVPDAPAEAETEAETPVDPLGRGSPRGMVDGMIAALADHDYPRAAQYLDLSEIPQAARASAGPALARGLQAVLDRSGSILPTYQLSSAPEGTVGDELPPEQDSFAVMRTEEGLIDLLAHQVESTDGIAIWQVMPDTLSLVQDVAMGLGVGLVDLWTPRIIAGERIAGVPVAHWVAVGIVALLALVIARGLTTALFWLAARIWPVLREGRARHVGRAILLPAGLFLASVIFSFATFLIGVSVVARAQLAPIVEIVSWIAIGWLVWRAVDAVARTSLDAMSRRGRLGAVSVVTLLRRAAKIATVVIVLIAAAGSVGLNLTGWLAALGLGGLAFALGAQKTIEHLVGSLSLIADQPVRIGDFCQVDGLLGTVEDIGMRSTRLRTLDRTLVTIPNGLLSQARIENLTSRDRFRYAPTLTLVYDTTPAQMRDVLERLRGLLDAHDSVTAEPARVRFVSFGASSLDVEIFAYVVAADFDAFTAIQEELNLAVMEIVASCGSAFAFPSRTVYLH